MPECATPLKEAQSAAAVLMVRPARFAFNPQTAASNAFQQTPDEGTPSGRPSGTHGVSDLALREFDAMTDGLRREGVHVIVADDTEVPVKPDAVFPNNWVSFHRDGTVVLYPMLAANRRTERREDVIRQVINDGGFRITRTVDLSGRENAGKYLEGTGSLVLDRVHRVAYANLSPRTDLDVLGDFAQQLDYDLVTFEAFDGKGNAVYHTNVLMAVGSGFAVVCGAAIVQPQHREAVFSKLSSAGHEIIDLTLSQMHEFAGNLLELAPPGRNVIALSTSAWRSLDPKQRRVLEKYGGILAADIPVIERYGGGGVRCMLAEIHLPMRI
jgi:hypothetical protein